MRTKTVGLIIAVPVLVLASLQLAAARELTFSTHLPPVGVVNQEGIQVMFDNVSAATNGEITPKYYWAGQLYDAAGNFEAIRDGVIDVAFTQPADAQADMPANLLFADLYHLGLDPYVTAGAMNETLLLDCPQCVQEYANNNAMFMGAHSTTPTVMACADEITSMADLEGRKVIGQPTILPWVQTFNATQLDSPPPKRLEAMERGVADCTLISAEWLKGFSINEVTKTVVDVPTGAQFSISIATFNATTWEELSDEVQSAFLQEMPHTLQRILDGYQVRDEVAIAELKEKGVVFTDLGGAYEEALKAFLVGYEERVIAAAEDRGVSDAAVVVAAFTENLAKWEELMADNGREKFAELIWQEVYSKLDY